MTPQQGVFSRAWSLLRQNPWLLLFGVLAGLRLDVNFNGNSAIRRGWQVMRNGLGEILGTGIGITLLGLVYSLVIAAPFFAVLFPLMLSWSSAVFQACAGHVSQPAFSACVSNNFAGDGWMTLGVLFLGLVSAVLGSAWLTYQSAVFTLLYERLTGAPATVASSVTSV
jgi:hypothetical protein